MPQHRQCCWPLIVEISQAGSGVNKPAASPTTIRVSGCRVQPCRQTGWWKGAGVRGAGWAQQGQGALPGDDKELSVWEGGQQRDWVRVLG